MPTTLTCRTCGDVYDLPDHLNHAPCRSCGTENCRPQATGEALDKLQRATRLRLDGEYDNALRSYNLVLMDYEDEHEALWGKLLCEYGVEFVTDPSSGKRHATVHRPHSRPMQLQSDFRRACELAPVEIRMQYEAEAAYVDAAQTAINRLKEKAPPFDVFICHKTTPLTGEGYTEDYNRAAKLFVSLQGAGYRVFFAPFANLEPGASYEAGIYHALSTAKVMLLISSDAAFLTSAWVKSEWTRYLEMLDDGADKHLIPLMYGGMSDARLPKEIRLRGLQNIRMEDFDAAERLMKSLAQYTGKTTAPVAQPVPQPKPAPAVAQPQPAPAPAVKYAPESDFETETVEGGVAITDYTGPGGEVLIPPMIRGERVVEIWGSAFKRHEKLTKVIIPDGVSIIGDLAFVGCSSLTSITIPDSVTSIGSWAFEGCSSLTSVSIPNSVTSIGERAFTDCSSLTSVSIPESVTNLGSNPFADCQALTSIAVAAGNKKYYIRDSVLMSRDNLLVCYPAGLTARSYAIPAGVTSIGHSAFYSCRSLTSVSIPESVTSIEGFAFSVCSSLKSVSIPESVTSVGDWEFSAWISLTSVSIPESVTSIGECAFSGCSSLTSMRIPESVTSIGDWAFSGCSSLTSMRIPESVTSIGKEAFASCSKLTLRVHGCSAAHTYTQQNNLRFKVISSAPQSVQPSPQYQEKPSLLSRLFGKK